MDLEGGKKESQTERLTRERGSPSSRGDGMPSWSRFNGPEAKRGIGSGEGNDR